MVNTLYIEDKISAKGLKKIHIASTLGISYNSLYNKLHNVTDFTVVEFNALLDLLDCNTDEERKKILLIE